MDEYKVLVKPGDGANDHVKKMEGLISQLNQKLTEQKAEDNAKIRSLQKDKSDLEKRIESAEAAMIKLNIETQAQINAKNQEIVSLNGYLDSYRSDI